MVGENKHFGKLIIMDDVSGLEDKSNDFAKFLTVSQKFGCICLHIFHIIYPTKIHMADDFIPDKHF